VLRAGLSGQTTPTTVLPTATYATQGGMARVACTGVVIELVSAIPSNGYSVAVTARGPATVDVRFRGFGREESVKAVCFGSPIRYYGQQVPAAPLP